MREIRLLDDTLLYVHNAGEALSDHIVREQDYFEKEILEYLADKYPQHETILDIGANIGNHSVYFSQYLEYSSIIAFEPIPDNIELLMKNVKDRPNISIRQEAVGDKTEKVKMTIKRDNMGACEVNDFGTEVVQQTRVDDWFIISPVTLMKIDVEWRELQVLDGAKNTLKEDKPLILIEDSSQLYFDTLNSLGYDIIKAWNHHNTYLYGAR